MYISFSILLGLYGQFKKYQALTKKAQIYFGRGEQR